jgi:hypothetical protein
LDEFAKTQQQLFNENKEPVVNQMKKFSDKLQTHGNEIAKELASQMQQRFDSHLNSTNAILQDTIISSVKAIIKEELQSSMREQQFILPERVLAQLKQSNSMSSICPSSAPTPVHFSSSFIMNQHQQQQHQNSPGTFINNQMDPQTLIQTHLQKGEMNAAFQAALCASDLSILMGLCEMVSPAKVSFFCYIHCFFC